MHPLLPVPADADPQGGGAAAEFPRRARRRLAQHADRRPRRPAAQRVRPASSCGAERRAARRAVAAVRRSASSASRRRPIASASAADLKYGGTSTRLGSALDRARDELAGPAARRPRDGHRRRRHLRRRDRRIARQPEGAIDSGVHRRRRPGAVRARHPGHARRDAARGAQGHRRSSSTSCCRRPATPARPCRSTSKTMAGSSSTQEVTLPPDGESATVQGALHRDGRRRAPVPVQGADAGRRAGDAEQRARRADRGQRSRARRSSTSKASRGSRRSSSARAVEDDKNLQVVILQRTAENKYYRRDVEQRRRADRRLPEDARGAVRLPRAHPRQRRSGVVLARAAAHDRRLRQQARRRAADARRPPLVRRRRLGRHAGRRGAAGRASRRSRTPKYFSELPARPTRAGATFPVTQIAGDETASARKWNDMPPVTTVNPMHGVKPGATVLLTGARQPEAGSGRARVPALRPRQGDRDADSGLVAVADGRRRSPVTDTTHAMFWRRLVRWLVDGVPEQVNV